MSTAKLCDRKELTQRKARGEGEKEAEKAVRAVLYSLKVLVWLLVLEKLRHGPQQDKKKLFCYWIRPGQCFIALIFRNK